VHDTTTHCFCFVIRNFILCLLLTLTLLLLEICAFSTLGFALTSVSLLELELIVLLLEPALTSMVTTVGFDSSTWVIYVTKFNLGDLCDYLLLKLTSTVCIKYIDLLFADLKF